MKDISKKLGVLCTICLPILWASTSAHSKNIKFNQNKSSSIVINNDELFPESITYNPISDRYILGSFRQGAIFEVDENGNTKKIVEDSRLRSVFAVRIDSKRNRLLALTSDLGASVETHPDTVKQYATLAIYNLKSGKPIKHIDLSKLVPNEEHLVNGMTLDKKGNAYITDSFAASIYKVDTNGEASLFLKSDEFKGEGINLNGIVYHPDGYLLCAKKSNGIIYKIPLNNPNDFSPVISDQKYVGADGLILAGKNEVVIIANRTLGYNTDSAFAVSSTDNWSTMTTIDQFSFGDVYPTTGVLKNGEIAVVHSKLNTLVAAPISEKSKLRNYPIIEKIGHITEVTVK